MDIEFLVSTTNRIDSFFLEKIFQNNKKKNCNVLVINQCINIPVIELKHKNENIHCISVKEKGISKSRNLALDNATGDICVIADDDLVYTPNCINDIGMVYIEDSALDVAIFQVITPEGEPYKKYRSESFRIKKPWDQMQVSSVEITFKRKSVQDKQIRFNENLGLGAKYTAGEETNFIHDCVKKGLKVKYFPIPIVIHPKESSGKLFNKENVIAKGIVFANLFPILFLLLDVYFCIKWIPRYRHDYSFFEFFALLLKGNKLVLTKSI